MLARKESWHRKLSQNFTQFIPDSEIFPGYTANDRGAEMFAYPLRIEIKRTQKLDQGISIYQWYILIQQLLWVTQAKYTVISTIIISNVRSCLQNLWLTCSFRRFDHLRCKLTRPKAFTVWPTNRIQWNLSDVHSTFISQWNTGYVCLDIELFATCNMLARTLASHFGYLTHASLYASSTCGYLRLL